MWPTQTKQLLEKLKIDFPIIQAPMANAAAPKLIATVANAGVLGSLAAGYLSPTNISKAIHEIRALTSKPFAVNLFVPQVTEPSTDQINHMQNILNAYRKKLGIAENPPLTLLDEEKFFAEQLAVVIEEKISVLSFTFGIPSQEQIKRLKDNHTMLIGTATTIKEGIMLQASGCDAIVAQGSEAGGHRGSFYNINESFPLIGSMALISQLVNHVSIPVIGSGGIMDGRGLVAVLALGGSAVQMGTAFLTTTECEIHPRYKQMLLKSKEDETILTTVFSGKPARGLKNKFIQEMEQYADEILPYPIQHRLTIDIRKEASNQDEIEWMSLWAGQAASLTKELSAKELIKRTIQEAEFTLTRLGAKS